jgi:hypothetical protein
MRWKENSGGLWGSSGSPALLASSTVELFNDKQKRHSALKWVEFNNPDVVSDSDDFVISLLM